jgi:hypothetical protein
VHEGSCTHACMGGFSLRFEKHPQAHTFKSQVFFFFFVFPHFFNIKIYGKKIY